MATRSVAKSGPTGSMFIMLANDDQVKAMTERIRDSLGNQGMLTYFGGVLHPYFMARARARFAAEGDEVTGKWAPLKSSTIAIREDQGYGPGPINQRTGILHDYITRGRMSLKYFPGGGAIFTFPGQPPQGELAEKMRKAQMGDVYSNTPARPVIGMGMDDITYVYESLAMFILKDVTSRGAFG